MKWNIICVIFFCCFLSCKGQQPFGKEHLKLEKDIAMPHVNGRIDHMAFNSKDNILYVAALGNNTVEVIDLAKGSVINSINGIEEPQGIAYLTGQNEIAVASGATGDCVFFRAGSLEKIATVHLSGDADNVRFDSTEMKLYVGYGNGGLAMIDPVAHKQIGDVKLPAHPESFQLDKKNNKLYVNLPDDHSIVVIDLKTFSITATWKIPKYRANFPMALDTSDNIVFVGYRHPAVLVGYDSNSGEEISKNDLAGDVDDIFYSADNKEVIASGGDGFINIYERKPSGLILSANIPTTQGARTSLFIPTLNTYILAKRANNGNRASLAVYKITSIK